MGLRVASHIGLSNPDVYSVAHNRYFDYQLPFGVRLYPPSIRQRSDANLRGWTSLWLDLPRAEWVESYNDRLLPRNHKE